MQKMKKIPELFMSANWYPKELTTKLFEKGLSVGVRGFDTAREYKAESKVGSSLIAAMKAYGLKRSDVFIQTRICNEEIIRIGENFRKHEQGGVKKEVDKSLSKLQMEYIDCFMFHWPTPDYYIPVWRELEDMYEETNKISYIGICNCRLRHLLDMEKHCRILPHVLQIEITPFWQAKEERLFCQQHGIAVQAFSPLCKMIDLIKGNKVLNLLAEKYSVSIPQIILRWDYQSGIIPISQSGKPERITQNFDIWKFSLSEEDMDAINNLDCGYKYHLESATCSGF